MARESGLIVDANQSGFDAVLAFEALVRADERDRLLREKIFMEVLAPFAKLVEAKASMRMSAALAEAYRKGREARGNA
jgi:hypothetical protein